MPASIEARSNLFSKQCGERGEADIGAAIGADGDAKLSGLISTAASMARRSS